MDPAHGGSFLRFLQDPGAGPSFLQTGTQPGAVPPPIPFPLFCTQPPPLPAAAPTGPVRAPTRSSTGRRRRVEAVHEAGTRMYYSTEEDLRLLPPLVDELRPPVDPLLPQLDELPPQVDELPPQVDKLLLPDPVADYPRWRPSSTSLSPPHHPRMAEGSGTDVPRICRGADADGSRWGFADADGRRG
uniref:Uncharacterized protein n=1 Tax=Leersia perrieri TaxID=77586 RepID=A0A0D9XCK1_9ORYZ